MYFGCQCSSARCSRLLSERLTLFGIFSAEIMVRPGVLRMDSAPHSCALPVELGSALLPVHLQRAFFSDRVRPLKDPVLPCGEPPEDLRLHRFWPGETEVGLEA